MGGMAAAFAPLVAEALAPRDGERGATTIEWVPHGVVAAILPFNWPVSVMANKVLPGAARRQHGRGQGAADLSRAPCCLVAAAMAEALPPGVLNVVNGPDAALGAALVAHPDVDMVSFTGGVRTGPGRHGRGRRHDPARGARARRERRRPSWRPTSTVDAALADRLVEAAFVTSGQVCMAIKRLYVHRDRLDETVDALRRPAGRRGGRGRAGRRGDDGSRCTRPRRGTGWRPSSSEAAAAGRGAAPAGPGARRGRRSRGATSSRPRSWWRLRPTRSIVREEQFAPALPVIPYDDIDEAVAAAQRHPFGLCASVWSNDDALAADVAARLSAGTVFVNAHGMSAMDMYAPMGGWKQSGFGVELGTEGMQAFARQRVQRACDRARHGQEEST